MNSSMKDSQITSDSPYKNGMTHPIDALDENFIDEISKNTIIPFVMKRFERKGRSQKKTEEKILVRQERPFLKLPILVICRLGRKLRLETGRSFFMIWKLRKLVGSSEKILDKKQKQMKSIGYECICSAAQMPKKEMITGAKCLKYLLSKKISHNIGIGFHKIIEASLKKGQRKNGYLLKLKQCEIRRKSMRQNRQPHLKPPGNIQSSQRREQTFPNNLR